MTVCLGHPTINRSGKRGGTSSAECNGTITEQRADSKWGEQQASRTASGGGRRKKGPLCQMLLRGTGDENWQWTRGEPNSHCRGKSITGETSRENTEKGNAESSTVLLVQYGRD